MSGSGAILGRIAHDLRGPLMPLRTAAWLLKNELGATGRAGDLADIIDRQSAQLARMLDELSEWGRHAGDRLSLDRARQEVGLALDMAIGAMECDVRLHYAGDAAAATVHADQHRLGQLLRTLAEHAAHRAPGEPVHVDVSADTDWLRIHVRDHGPALDQASRERLLSEPQPVPFDQGLGLRLLMARAIAEAHGGTLVAESGEGDGLSLRLTLPLEG